MRTEDMGTLNVAETKLTGVGIELGTPDAQVRISLEFLKADGSYSDPVVATCPPEFWDFMCRVGDYDKLLQSFQRAQSQI